MPIRPRSPSIPVALFTFLAFAACGPGTARVQPEPAPGGSSGTAASASSGGAGGNGGSGGTARAGTGGSAGTISICGPDDCPMPAAPGICGDGELTEDEACDDGNTSDGDGCVASCLEVERGYSCSPPGVPCHRVALCGDSVVNSNEMCDDGNTGAGDGCSARCKLENGYRCDGEPSTCTATTCGDGAQEGAESCDDGNVVPLDGCSDTCQAEPDCSGGACTSGCGDGLVIDEECDDGNTLDGDGCSAGCTREAGFDCVQRPACTDVGGECTLAVPAVFRDFTPEHPDFRCGVATPRPDVAADLDAEAKPVLVSGDPGCIESPETFSDWFRSRETNRTVPRRLYLFDDDAGGYVNRFGPNGERWIDLNGAELDGNPVFLPIDGAPEAFDAELSVATVPPEYTGDGSWHPESDFVPDAGLHNFLFTSEVAYWFRFDAGFAAELTFLGDDDLWVFVNGRLALDLGGLHTPESGSVTVSDATAADFGLEAGRVYAVKVFHAERNPTGSSFQLTLTGFQNTPSECEPVCGDGIVSLGEECDDGKNDGGYGECEPGCRVGARCGDGIVQPGEDCDDGNRFEGDACGSACRELVVR